MADTSKSQIDKLMELKQLYEQGILTKEEMEAEKAKILSVSTPKPDIPISESQSPSATSPDPVATITDGGEAKSLFNKIILGIASVVVVVIVGLVGFYLLNQKESAMVPVKDIELSEIAESKDDGYNSILSERKLTEEDLIGKSKKELELLRNSIFARYGYRFKRDDFFQHFTQFSWYTPMTSDESTIIGKFSEIEKYNVDFIKRIEDDTTNTDSGNSLKDTFESKFNSATLVKHPTGFCYPDFFENTTLFVDDVPAEVEVYSWEGIKICYWPLLGNWSTLDDFPYKGTYISPTDKVKNVVYTATNKGIFSGYTEKGDIYYLKRKIIPDEVPHGKVLVLIHPFSNKGNATDKLTKMIANW